jgi:Bacterial Ig-like domain (group 3)
MARRPTLVARRAIVGCLLGAGLAIAGGIAGAQPAAAAPAPAAGTWQSAKTVVLPPVINFGQFATINSIACPSSGNCTAVGHFNDSHDDRVAIADSEVNHTWAAAIQPFGTVEEFFSDLDLLSVSCSSAGNCTAVGVFTYKSEWTAGLVLNETKGKWLLARYFYQSDKGVQVSSVSCPHKTNDACAAGGYYVDASGKTQALLLYESANGNWFTLPAVPGLATLNAGGNAAVTSVSCPSAGNCAAGGYYTDSNANRQAFVITEKKGTFGNARTVAGTLNTGEYAQVNGLSCASAGNCVAAGQYFRYVAPNVSTQAVEATEKNGAWSAAAEVPGTGSLNADGLAVATSVSCAPSSGPLNCALGGRFQDKNAHAQAFVDLLKNGGWQKASAIATAHNLGGYAQVSTVSCPTAGNCAAGGYYLTAASSSQKYEAFLVSLEGFAWKPAEEVPGTNTLNAGMTAHVNAVSCPSVGFCAAGGFYSDGHLGGTLPFTVDGAVTQPTATALSLSAATVKYGHEQSEKISVTVTPADAGPATGTVTVTAGKTGLCQVKLTAGKASCTLAAKKLGPGNYHLTASYAGATYFAKSASAAKALKVAG